MEACTSLTSPELSMSVMKDIKVWFVVRSGIDEEEPYIYIKDLSSSTSHRGAIVQRFLVMGGGTSAAKMYYAWNMLWTKIIRTLQLYLENYKQQCTELTYRLSKSRFGMLSWRFFVVVVCIEVWQ